MVNKRLSSWLLLLGGLWSFPALTADDVPLSSFQRTSYTQENGAPAAPRFLLQTSDGFLWFVSAGALYRFDGVRFERFEVEDDERLPFEGMRSIRADRKSGIWIGYIAGGVAYLRDGKLTFYGAESGLPHGKQVTVIHDSGAGVLAGTQDGLFELHGSRWIAVPGLNTQAIDDVLTDSKGRLWVKVPGAAFYRKADQKEFRRVALPADDGVVAGLFDAPDGEVWYWNNVGQSNLCRLHADSVPSCWQAEGVVRPLFDTDRAIWWSSPDRVYRVSDVSSLAPTNPRALMARAQSVDVAGSYLFRSAEGNMWAYGPKGTTRLRKPAIKKMGTPSGGLAAAVGGGVWLISFERGLMRIGNESSARDPLYEGEDGSLWVKSATVGDESSAFVPKERKAASSEAVVLQRFLAPALTGVRLDRDAEGSLFVGRLSPPGLVRFSGDEVKDIPLPALDRGAVLRGAKRDSEGHLWVGASRNSVSLYQQRDDVWVAFGDREIPKDLPLNGFAFDRHNTLWVAAGASGVVAVDRSGSRRFGRPNGLDIGTAGDVYQVGDQVWVAGTQGIAVFHKDRFVTLIGMGNERFVGASGLAYLPNGDVWLNGSEGVSRIEAQEWKRALTTPGYQVRFTRLDRWDGIDSPALQGPNPSAAVEEDGTLWFGMRTGLYRIRAEDLGKALPPPRVIPGALLVDGKEHAWSDDLELSPGLHRVSFGILAPGAERPERTRFRYRFSRNGQWGDWTFLGAERQISLDGLGHGRYTVDVAASGRDGDWSASPTRLEFQVLPAFHQTRLFYGLLVLAAVIVLTFLYLLRIRQLSARIRGEMSARLRERERIARDLHDTLLQGMQGLLLSFQSIAAKLAPQDPLRARMESVLDRTQDVLREGRDRVSQLRDPLASTLDLADSLQRHAHDLAVEKKLLCEVSVPMLPRPLQPVAYEELLQVGREAISNAFQHSKGSEVRVNLTYSDEGVLLTVHDDGIGVHAGAGHAPGHWGLPGMQERAKGIGATLTLRRRAEGGTEVKMFVPTARAYPAGKSATSKQTLVSASPNGE